MAPCTPSDNTLNPVPKPGVPIPGFGIPFSPVQTPSPELDLPTEVIEDILGLVESLGALFPSGLFKPNPEFSTKSVLDMVMNILSQISPFLSFYNFIMAALRMFACIIEVLCAIPNPFAVVAKLKKLFTECLPPFINLFPWLALIAMIIAFLLLILALVDYIIITIENIVAVIIKNLETLSNGLKLQDAHSTLAAAQKIASLICFIQNILAVLVAIGAIIDIIKALAIIAGFTVCSDNDSDGCCTPDLCPDFVKNTPDGIIVEHGKLIYYNQIEANVANIFSSLGVSGIENLVNVPPVRPERWQLLDQNFSTATYPISSIITPVSNPNDPTSTNIFWPDPLEYKADLTLKKAPYTVDLRVKLDPIQFGFSDIKGIRFFRIKNCIVVRKPYFGLVNKDNQIELSYFGAVFNLEGGLVYEDDGTTPYFISGVQGTLNTFIHKPNALASSNNDLPNIDDAIVFDDASFIWKPNAAGLSSYQLVTVGCIPILNTEKAVQNAIILAEGIAPVLQKITPALPDITATQTCISTALANFRKDVSPSSAAEFQAITVNCLNDLKSQTTSIVCNAITTAVSQFKSSITLDTDVQFTSRVILVTVTLKDATGTNLSLNIPSQCVNELENKLKGEVSLGEISSFTYDGSATFIAKISSKTTGAGQLTVSFDDQIFNVVIPGNNTTTSKIEENILLYNFIESHVEAVPRRDETDIAGTNSGD